MNKRGTSRTSREKVLLLVVLVLALGFLGWNFAFVPLQNRINQLHTERDLLQAEVDRLENKIRQRADLEREWAEMEEERKHLSILLPDQEQLPLVLGNFEDLIDRQPVKMGLLRSEGFVDREDYQGLTFRAGFEGQGSNLLYLFGELERFSHLLITKETTWNIEEDKDSKLEMIFTLVLLEEELKNDPEEGSTETILPTRTDPDRVDLWAGHS